MQDGLFSDGVVCFVARVCPVVYQGTEERAGFPPVIRIWELPGDISRIVSGVEADKVPGYLARDVFYVLYYGSLALSIAFPP